MTLDDATTVAYRDQPVEQIFSGCQNPLDRLPVKLVGFDLPPQTRRHFQHEVRTWLSELQVLRFKPNLDPPRSNSISTCYLITHSAGSKHKT